MPRPVLLLSCMLCLATGLALLGLAQSGSSPVTEHRLPASDANVDLVRAFYEAANEVLATGDVATLDDIVADDLVEHPARVVGAGRSGLGRELAARGVVFPGSRLMVDALRAAGPDVVVAQVRHEGPASGSFLGRPVPGDLAAGGAIEQFRIAGGRIVEHWGSLRDATLLSPLWSLTPREESLAGRHVFAWRRLFWEPGSALEVTDNPASWFLLVESGQLSVEAGTGASIAAGTKEAGFPRMIGGIGWASLTSGALLTVPSEVAFSVRNTAGGVASAVLVALWIQESSSPIDKPTLPGVSQKELRADALGLAFGDTGTVELAAGVTANVLMTVSGVTVPAGATVALGMIALTPATALTIGGGTGPLMLAVESGHLNLTATGGSFRARDPTGLIFEQSTQASLVPGYVAHVEPGVATTWSAAGDPVVALVVTISSTVLV